MEIVLKQGDRLPVPEGCKATIDGNEVVIEKKEQEFKDGDVLVTISRDGYNCPFIFKGIDNKGYNMFHVGLTCDKEVVISDTIGSRFGNKKPVFATEEENL